MTKPDALALADALDGLCIEPSLDIRSAAELRRLHAENEALRKDAERFRWIASQGGSWETEAFLNGLTPDEYTAAVDAEMKGQA